MESDGGRRRRRLTVADHMSVLDSSSLRDLLNVRDDNCGDSLRGLTLGAVLGCEERRLGTVTVNRTLFDIIRDEKSGISCRGHVGPNNKKSWKFFKDRLRRTTAAWAPSSSTLEDCRIQISPPIPAPPVTSNSVPTTPAVTTNAPARSDETILAINQPENETTSATAPVITRLAAALAAERELQQPRQGSERNGSNSDAVGEGGREASAASVEEAEAGVEGAPIRMSLMALLEETDRQAGVVGSGLLGTAVEEGEEGKEGGQEGGEYVCCVCMVRHKGAAFIPCGHTFCRLCCRELWVSRGNCPLCNGFILEILDIF